MLSIPAVLVSHEYGLRICWGAQRGSQISSGRVDLAGGSTVLPTPCETLYIEPSNSEPEDATLKGDYLRQVVELLFGGIPTALEVHFM
jgi:hypothetical protein